MCPVFMLETFRATAPKHFAAQAVFCAFLGLQNKLLQTTKCLSAFGNPSRCSFLFLYYLTEMLSLSLSSTSAKAFKYLVHTHACLSAGCDRYGGGGRGKEGRRKREMYAAGEFFFGENECLLGGDRKGFRGMSWWLMRNGCVGMSSSCAFPKCFTS